MYLVEHMCRDSDLCLIWHTHVQEGERTCALSSIYVLQHTYICVWTATCICRHMRLGMRTRLSARCICIEFKVRAVASILVNAYTCVLQITDMPALTYTCVRVIVGVWSNIYVCPAGHICAKTGKHMCLTRHIDVYPCICVWPVTYVPVQAYTFVRGVIYDCPDFGVCTNTDVPVQAYACVWTADSDSRE